MIDGYCRILLLLLVASLSLRAQSSLGGNDAGAEPASTPVAPAPTMEPDSNAPPNDPAVPMLKQAYGMLTKGDMDGALQLTDEAVKNNPKSFAALTLRGMIYSQKKQWTSAEGDFAAALAIDPNNLVVKFNLAEIRFVQKQYDVARTRFLPLAKDPVMGDFAQYKVFLCDLLSGNEAQARKELDVFNAAETHPSYYFSNAAWDLYHKNPDDARSWLISAANIYIPSKNQFYASPLKDLGYLPLPPQKEASGL
jgi:Tfp pilus assembly protein PilF